MAKISIMEAEKVEFVKVKVTRKKKPDWMKKTTAKEKNFFRYDKKGAAYC